MAEGNDPYWQTAAVSYLVLQENKDTESLMWTSALIETTGAWFVFVFFAPPRACIYTLLGAEISTDSYLKMRSLKSSETTLDV